MSGLLLTFYLQDKTKVNVSQLPNNKGYRFELYEDDSDNCLVTYDYNPNEYLTKEQELTRKKAEAIACFEMLKDHFKISREDE